LAHRPRRSTIAWGRPATHDSNFSPASILTASRTSASISLPGHFPHEEKKQARGPSWRERGAATDSVETNLAEVEDVLPAGRSVSLPSSSSAAAPTFCEARKKQGSAVALFPKREDPRLPHIRSRKDLRRPRLLDLRRRLAFDREKPCFSWRSIFHWRIYIGPAEVLNPFRQKTDRSRSWTSFRTQFLKTVREFGPTHCFERSCGRLLQKLLVFCHEKTARPLEKRSGLEPMENPRNAELINYVHEHQLQLLGATKTTKTRPDEIS